MKNTFKLFTRLSMRTVLLGCVLWLCSPVTLAANEQVIGVVENLHGILLDNMQNAKERGYQGRYEAVLPFVEQKFDLPLIVKVILSRYWSKFSEEQKQGFIELFKELTVATYASRFAEYNNEKFVTKSVEELKKGRLLVKTEIQSEGEDPVSLDYLMHRKDGQWQIISVVANGINDLSLKRAEYGTIIKDQGFDALVKQIREKITQYETS